MTTFNIAFIGAGNMAHAIVCGLLANNYLPEKIWMANRTLEKLNYYREQYAVHITQNNQESAKNADILILSVKPQQIHALCLELKNIIADKKPLVISVAAGITTQMLQKWLGQNIPVVRAMPNTPAMVNAGVTGLYATDAVNETQKNAAESIFRAVGLTVWFSDEKQINIVAALSGSGPAYIFLVMEAMQEAAQQLGLSPETAKLLALETTFGAARLALESDQELAALRRSVTSPQGSTEKALAVLEKRNIRESFLEAMKAAWQRSDEISNSLTSANGK